MRKDICKLKWPKGFPWMQPVIGDRYQAHCKLWKKSFHIECLEIHQVRCLASCGSHRNKKPKETSQRTFKPNSENLQLSEFVLWEEDKVVNREILYSLKVVEHIFDETTSSQVKKVIWIYSILFWEIWWNSKLL